MKKGFTLVELLAVIVILAMLVTLTILYVRPILNNSKDDLLEIQKNNIEKAAKTYYLENENLEQSTCINVSKLVSEGYIDSDEVLNPKTKEPMNGSVDVTLKNNKYSYKYSADECPRTVYLWYTGSKVDGPVLNQKLKNTYYETLEEGKTWYLKYTVKKEEVIKSEACAIYNIQGKREEFCIQGGRDLNQNSYYGWSTTKEDSTGNVEILKKLETKLPQNSCSFSYESSNCYYSSIRLNSYNVGDIYSNNDESYCIVNSEGKSGCCWSNCNF